MKQIISVFVEGNYEILERQSKGVRLSAKEMQAAIADYGRRLTNPPEEHFALATFGRIEVGEPAYWVDLPFYTAEEGRSDLEIRLTIYDRLDTHCQFVFEIDDILVP